MEEDRKKQIHEKGFDMGSSQTEDVTEYNNKIKVGVKILGDAILDLGSLKKAIGRYTVTKDAIIEALTKNNVVKLREVSDYFYRTSGIYKRACEYFAQLYRYDWYIVPEVSGDIEDPELQEKIKKDFIKNLSFLDNSNVKKVCGDIALNVVKNGVYYGYINMGDDYMELQELPVNYCRSRYNVRGRNAVEFNMKFFDEQFLDIEYRLKVLKLFPEEFQKGYLLYREGKLLSDNIAANNTTCSDNNGWYLLDPNFTVKICFDRNELPLLINATPHLLDLDAAQDLDRKKQMQKLLKILIQKLPMDKNGDLIFDIDEAKDIHNNAVEMLSRAVGVDVLTTFADVEEIDLSDKNTTASQDDLQKVERSVFNAMGISKNLFNTDGNLSMEKSILDDESSIRPLLQQFNMMWSHVIDMRNSDRKKYRFKFYMLETTQNNYRELSKMYKEQVQIGYSKMLPQIALGHSQSFILNTAYFENKVLNLNTLMIPPLMSSVMSAENILGTNGENTTSKIQETLEEDSEGGRPELPDDQKSDKTLANLESQS